MAKSNSRKEEGMNEAEERTSEMPPLKKKMKRNDLDSSSSKAAQTTKANNTSAAVDADADADGGKKGISSKEDHGNAMPATETESSSSSEGSQTPPPPPPEEVGKYVSVTKTLNLRVDSFENMDDVKDKFSKFECIETNLQKLLFTEIGFENDQEFDFERKEDGSNVHLNLHYGARLRVNIKVSWGATTTTDDKFVTLDVYSWDTISDVKSKFQDKEGTPANQLTLFYGRKQLDDLHTIAAYDIKNYSTLDAFFFEEDMIEISVVTPRRWDSIIVKVKLSLTVMTLKRMIHCCMGLFAVDRQELIYNGFLLENNQRLSDYNIKMGSILDLDFIRRTSGMKIIVKTLTGRRIPIYVDSSDTVDTLKSEIRYREGYPEEGQRLEFAGRQLENGRTTRTVGDYNIQEGSTVHLFLKGS